MYRIGIFCIGFLAQGFLGQIVAEQLKTNDPNSIGKMAKGWYLFQLFIYLVGFGFCMYGLTIFYNPIILTQCGHDVSNFGKKKNIYFLLCCLIVF